MNWQDLVLLGVLYMLVSFGVTIGYHRYLTHSGFKANRVVKCVLIVLGTMVSRGVLSRGQRTIGCTTPTRTRRGISTALSLAETWCVASSTLR